MLEHLAEPARRAQMRVLSPFTVEERTHLLRLLEKFVDEFNGSTRVPLDADRAHAEVTVNRPRRRAS
jgi:hypothetical protein